MFKFPIRFLVVLITILLYSPPTSAQVSIAGRIAQNVCWYMSKGFPFNGAVKMAMDPTYLLIDQRGVTPGYVRQNGQYILSGMVAERERVGADAFAKNSFRAIAQICPNRLSIEEYNFIKRL